MWFIFVITICLFMGICTTIVAIFVPGCYPRVPVVRSLFTRACFWMMDCPCFRIWTFTCFTVFCSFRTIPASSLIITFQSTGLFFHFTRFANHTARTRPTDGATGATGGAARRICILSIPTITDTECMTIGTYALAIAVICMVRFQTRINTRIITAECFARRHSACVD